MELVQQWTELNTRPRWLYTHDGWLEYGYKEHPGLFRTSASDTYDIRLQPLNGPAAPLLAAGQRTAELIAERAALVGRPIILLLSGGLDSHFMARSFLRAGVPFTAAIIRHANRMNEHDTFSAYRFAHTHGIRFQTLDLDMQELMASGWAAESAALSQCKHLGYAPWCWALEKLQSQGYCVSGFNEPEVCWEPDLEAQVRGDYTKGQWVFYDHERFSSFIKYLTAKGIDAVPSFYQYDRGIWCSYITNPMIRRMVAGRYNRRVMSSDSVKHLAYQLPTRVKYTGYERILTELFTRSEHLRNNMPFKCWTSLSIPYFDLIDQLGIVL